MRTRLARATVRALRRSRHDDPRCPSVFQNLGHFGLSCPSAHNLTPFVKIQGQDDLVWDIACALLLDDAWLEVELTSRQSEGGNAAKLVRLQELKIKQAQGRIAKIREGFEGGLYSLVEAKRRIDEYEHSVANAEEQIRRLQKELGAPDVAAADLEALKQELSLLRTKNLNSATFAEKREVVAKLGIKVYPSEDLKSVRIACGGSFRFHGDGQCGGDNCRKVVVGSASRTGVADLPLHYGKASPHICGQ